MRMLSRKQFFIALLLIIACFLNFTSPVLAKPTSVSDCLDGSSDCEEIDDSKQNKQKEDDAVKDDKQDEDNADDIGDSKTSIFVSFLKMIVAIAIILIMIYALLKFLNKRNKSFQKLGNLENLGGISVGANKSVQIIRVANKFYLIGVGENVEMLQEIDESVIQDDWLTHNDNTTENKGMLDKILNSQSKTSSQSKQSYFKQMFKKELNTLSTNRKKLIKNQKEREEDHE